ncbi:hypothetical protein Dip510_001963 [Elusimicrobium posterum]|uniref:hypothetical protein n=1 Tax=Elusimicrobium posterum TaxID=3116653 RepID=UPI003C74F133
MKRLICLLCLSLLSGILYANDYIQPIGGINTATFGKSRDLSVKSNKEALEHNNPIIRRFIQKANNSHSKERSKMQTSALKASWNKYLGSDTDVKKAQQEYNNAYLKSEKFSSKEYAAFLKEVKDTVNILKESEREYKSLLIQLQKDHISWEIAWNVRDAVSGLSHEVWQERSDKERAAAKKYNATGDKIDSVAHKYTLASYEFNKLVKKYKTFAE